MKRPPSTEIVWPVIYEASSLERKITKSEISWTEPNLFKGMSSISLVLALSSRYAVMSVSIKPGATEFTVIPLEPTSLASDFVKPLKPALADE